MESDMQGIIARFSRSADHAASVATMKLGNLGMKVEISILTALKAVLTAA